MTIENPPDRYVINMDGHYTFTFWDGGYKVSWGLLLKAGDVVVPKEFKIYRNTKAIDMKDLGYETK